MGACRTDRENQHYSGKILKLKKTAYDQKTGNNVKARVELNQGIETIVNLGPENQLNELGIKADKAFSMRAGPVIIQGKKALVAEEVRMGDQKATIDWEKARKTKS